MDEFSGVSKSSASPGGAGRRAWFGLSVVLGPVLLVSMDGSVLFLAMPRITQALDPTADQALWILDVYGFVVGSLLIAFGNLGDRFGRLRLLMAGTAVFGLGSTSAALSPSPELLIASRGLMGLGGATLLPSGLAVLSELFEDARQRSRAIGIPSSAVSFSAISTGEPFSSSICRSQRSSSFWHRSFCERFAQPDPAASTYRASHFRRAGSC